MDALVPAFILAGLAEVGDRTQMLALLLGKRFAPRRGAVLAGVALAALLNMGVGAGAGAALARVVNHQAIQLMTGLALVMAGSGAAFRGKPPPPVEAWRLGAFASSAGAFLILSFLDKTQFMVATVAAGNGEPALAAIGAAAGIAAANAPAVMLGDEWPALVPLRGIRIGAGLLLALGGLAIALRALELV
jgi:putative Ca2+/H+ antiporter (TMEM165/GDT1 family)